MKYIEGNQVRMYGVILEANASTLTQGSSYGDRPEGKSYQYYI